jgi:hypothetical protein
MKTNTIDNENLNSKKNINKQLHFPNLFNKTINSSQNCLLTQKPFSLKNSKLFKKKKNDINLVEILNIDEKVSNIINTELNLKRQRIKIDENKSIQNFRLGLNKKKEEDEDDKENGKDNNTSEILKKEEKNEDNIEKIETDLKDKERMLEKKFGEKFNFLKKSKNDCQIINDKLSKLIEEIENNKMEEKILMDYAKDFDSNFEKNLNAKDENEDEYMDENNKNSNYLNDVNKKMQKEFENKNKLILFRQKRENKKKLLRENILGKEELKLKLESELIKKKDIFNQAKEEFISVRNDLINRYHMKLYEGISYHNEGLPSIIKDIWKLNVQVNTNFMPSYLDQKSIQYLFQKAKQSIEINKLRQEIKEAENDFILNLKEWKNNDNIELNNNDYPNKKTNKFFNKNDESKNLPFDESELFKTKISDISISYLEPYPKTKQFILDYRKNHPQKFKKEMPTIKFKTLKFKSWNIPSKIIEKNKKVEKLKYFLEMKLNQNEFNDKKEVERLTKEFILNNYQKKYKVNIETLFGSLFGDKKNEMLIYYSRLEKDMRDNNKLIQFHTKYNGIKFK